MPFVVAVLVLVPPQIHVERMQAATAGSYWDTLRDFLHVGPVADFPIPVDGRGGSPFEPAHMWFLAYLLAFTLGSSRRCGRCDATRREGRRSHGGSRPPRLLGATLAVAAIEGAHAAEDAGGWSRWAYPAFLVLGFLLAADGAVEARLVALRRELAIAATGAFVAMAASGAALHERLGDALLTGHAPEAVAWRIGQGVTGCLLVGAVLGALGARARRPRSTGATPALEWARTAALPVYVVHQTVGVVCAYVLVRADVPVGLALPALIVATMAVSVLFAETVRRTPVRAAFGLPDPRRRGAPRDGVDLAVAPG